MSYWYVMRVSLGKERKLQERLNLRISEGSLENLIRFLCPVEKEYYNVQGRKHIRDRVIYGGYLYLEAQEKVTKELVESIVGDADVKGFLSANGIPQVMSSVDVTRIIKDEILEQRIASKTTDVMEGSMVKILGGPFNDFKGEVREINHEKNKAKVVVKIFERESIVDISLTQIEKYD